VGFSINRLTSPACVVAAIAAIILSTCCAHASTLVDELNDWSQTAGHNDIATVDIGHTDAYLGDGCRIKCGQAGIGSYFYHLPGIRSFKASAFYFDREAGSVEVYASADGSTWTQVPFLSTLARPTVDRWSVAEISMSQLPVGTNYLGFSIHGGPDVFTPQVGRVSIDFGEANGAGPGGLSVMSAGSQACLTWYASSKATSYSVKRSTDGESYETIAGNVKSTMYADMTAKPGVPYWYTVSGRGPDGETEDCGSVQAHAQTGAVLFDDPLTDLSLTSDHSNGIGVGQLLPGLDTAKRTATGPQYITYNMPGLRTFSANEYFRGAVTDEIEAAISKDGDRWTVIKLKLATPANVDADWVVTRCEPADPLPHGYNYMRLTIHDGAGGQFGAAQIGQVRLTYGATN